MPTAITFKNFYKSHVLEKLFIHTERLIIRNLKPADVEDFHIYRSNPDVTKYQGFNVMDIEQCAAFIEKQKDKVFGTAGEWVQYAIENKVTKRLIGDCAIKLDILNIQIAETGITISHLEQGKGFAKEAMLAVMAFLFETKNVRRIAEITDAENVAAINLLKSMGFRQEGHFIENIFFKGKWGSEFLFAMLQREWNGKK